MKPVYACTSVAPARMRAHASSAVSMPPTAISSSFVPTRARSRRRTSSERVFSGAPEVIEGIGFGDALRLTDVDADRAGAAMGETRRSCGRAVVVEAHAIDQRAIARQAEQARLGISGLRFGRDRADLDEAEAACE